MAFLKMILTHFSFSFSFSYANYSGCTINLVVDSFKNVYLN